MPVRVRVGLLCMVTFLGTSCLWLHPEAPEPDGDGRQTDIHSSEIRTDVDGLMEVVALEYMPAAVMWQEFSVGDNMLGPADYYLKAVITYDPEIVTALRVATTPEDLARQVAGEVVPGAPLIEPWFPDPVVRHFMPVADHPGALAIDVPTYHVESLGNTLWADGYFFIVDEETIFLFCNTR